MTLAITPNSPEPSVKSNRSAGEDPRLTGAKSNSAAAVSRISLAVTTRSLDHSLWASSGMNSMNLTVTPFDPAEMEELDDLVIVDPSHRDDVELDRVEASRNGGVDAFEHPSQFVAFGQAKETVGDEGVDADVDTVETGVAQIVGDQGEGGAVGRHRQLDIQRRQPFDQQGEPRPHRRLAAGEANRPHTGLLDQDAGHPLDLLVGENAASLHPVHSLLGHAICAAEVAAIRDRDSKIGVHPTEGVDQRSCHVDHGNGPVGTITNMGA